MSPVGVTLRRTIGMARNLYSTALAVGGVLAAAAVSFAFGLESAEGGALVLPAVWATAIAPYLPVLAALLGMDVWSDERQSGRIDLLLTTAVREREFTMGKFLGVWLMSLATIVGFLVISLAAIGFFAPALSELSSVFDFVPALAVLAMQSALWCAVSVAASACFCHAAAAAGFAIALLVALPRGLWSALLEWAPNGRTAFGEMPLDAQATDFASGIVSTGIVVAYVALTFLSLFLASKTIASLRLRGKSSGRLRFSTGFACALALTLTALVIALGVRLDMTLDIPVGSAETRFAPRTREILSEVRGDISVTCFLPRRDPRFRATAHFLRALSREAESAGGSSLVIRFVDPSWDLGAAERLVRRGVRKDSLVFERGRRLIALPLADGCGERVCAATIQRLAMQPRRRTIYWTIGHGESKFDAYDSWGMSDIARELSDDGYRNLPLDLSGSDQIPSDCALIIVAGAKEDFSRAEIGRLEPYLKQGGRLFALVADPDSGGIASMLPRWGMRAKVATVPGGRTLHGTDLLVSEFSEHRIVSSLEGSRIVLERPLVLSPSAAVSGVGADRIEFSPLASVNGSCVAAAVERGGGTGDDLSIRPTRIVVVGDPGFAMNGQLELRGNANRDFFLNCVAFLAGVDASTASGIEADRLVTGMDREARLRFLLITGAVIPGLVFCIIFLNVVRRRRRK